MQRPTITLDTLVLDPGSHTPDSGQYCLLEATSYLAGEPWSDHPACVSPALGAFGRALNDGLFRAHLDLLAPYAPRLIGTAGQPAADVAAAYVLADWAVRDMAPRTLDAAGLAEEAARLRALSPVTDKESVGSAGGSVARAADAAYAAARAADAAGAADAAYAAARAAYAAGAADAAYAADAAARAAAHAARAAGAADAAYAAAHAAAHAARAADAADAAYAADAPSVKDTEAAQHEIRLSALAAFDRALACYAPTASVAS